MPIDLTQQIPRYEGGDTRQFTLAMTVSIPSTVAFVMFNTDGASLALAAVQSGNTVAQTPSGVFFFNRVLPESAGFYTWEWTAWDSGSRTYKSRGEIEIIRTEAHSFFSYADIPDVLRSARVAFGKADITMRDLRPVCQAADGYIDSWLGKITSVPISSPTALIKDMSKVYALWNWYSDHYSSEKDEAPPTIAKRKESYDEMLKMIVAGSLSLPGIALDVQFSEVVTVSPDGTRSPVFTMLPFEEQELPQSLVEFDEDNYD